jgi:WD40 repeat protein
VETIATKPKKSKPTSVPHLPTNLIIEHVLPLLDRDSWISLCCMNREMYDASRALSLLWPLQLHISKGKAVRSVAFSSDGDFLACGSDDTIVRVWNRSNGICSTLKARTRSSVQNVSFSPGRWPTSRDCICGLGVSNSTVVSCRQ